MSTPPTTDEQFWQLIDTFINTANEKAQTMDRNVIGPALLFAATRFNAYMLAMATGNVEDFGKQKEAAMKYYLEQHEKMLRDNFTDFESNFEKYRAS
ncbi:DUF3144 domain-containing protein [Pseudoduganella namucuonensis]|uniref:DUF3144 domain-containing protein n=1 Tax=Pseudoduganella namucuonensis TaxID=1035707 RepID=A0A1I7FH14_9BURK|nr:DUF3144 domain-containing protein [Pseudoduganella namucuonensis]SFU35481.1 Protein of unknown function [Pseudoduganella namucuonensis]